MIIKNNIIYPKIFYKPTQWTLNPTPSPIKLTTKFPQPPWQSQTPSSTTVSNSTMAKDWWSIRIVGRSLCWDFCSLFLGEMGRFKWRGWRCLSMLVKGRKRRRTRRRERKIVVKDFSNISTRTQPTAIPTPTTKPHTATNSEQNGANSSTTLQCFTEKSMANTKLPPQCRISLLSFKLSFLKLKLIILLWSL